ncbi:hypothetical protein [Delftia acidovorans]|uniref:hypothetical protein n=1 Tax=Delftia acidovorans TaxID=80866 RepID=UPI002431DD64|nr:hypothetical protein [Delftia acidovorans]
MTREPDHLIAAAAGLDRSARHAADLWPTCGALHPGPAAPTPPDPQMETAQGLCALR